MPVVLALCGMGGTIGPGPLGTPLGPRIRIGGTALVSWLFCPVVFASGRFCLASDGVGAVPGVGGLVSGGVRGVGGVEKCGAGAPRCEGGWVRSARQV